MSTSPKAANVAEHKDSMQNVGLIIPTYNAAANWLELKASLNLQRLQPEQILIIDSQSSDATEALAHECGYRFVTVARAEFNHGATRQAACKYFPHAEIVVFMTQDAVLANGEAISNLCLPFENPCIAAAYGRQIPRVQANPIERHARLFNYPSTSEIRSFASRHKLGIKAVFFSNSFAAYRKSALEEVGGFPTQVILGEDSIVAARLLEKGYKLAYQADAIAIHSHALQIRREFSRYFDTGVHHSREPWLLETFGKPAGEGMRFVISELRSLSSEAPLWIPLALLRTLSKYVGYKLGLLEDKLPVGLSRFLSDHPNFWNQHR